MENKTVAFSPLEVEVVFGKFPPNYEQIKKAFPLAENTNVIFAYGRQVYVPKSDKIAPEILAHERIHCERQLKIGLDEWWQKYIEDPVFRYNEELLAHRVEYSFLRGLFPGQDEKHRISKHIAKKLSHPLYGGLVTLKRAMKDLKQ